MKPKAIYQFSKTAHSQHGFVLLEVMVALLVFSLGILGLVSMQATSLINISESQYRTEAAIWANTLIGQIRTADPTTRGTTFATAGSSYTTWKNQLINSTSGLPVASNTPPTVTITNNQVVISIFWRSRSGSGNHQYVITAQLD